MSKTKIKSTKKPAFKIPAGYKHAPTGVNTSAVDWLKTSIIEGKVLEIKDVTIPKKGKEPAKDTRLMVVETSHGDVAIWQKAQLAGLFDSVEVGSSVYIAHLGIKKLKGGKSMHEFSTAFK